MRSLNFVFFLALLTSVPQTASAQPLARRLQPLIDGHEGEVAVAVKHLAKGETFTHEADEPMPTASLIKLPIMVEAYRQAAEGKIILEEPVTFRDEDRTPGSGLLSTHFSSGTTFPLRDAIRLMIGWSDNSATNLVLAKIGLPATNSYMEQLGLPNTKVHAFVFRPDTSIARDRSRLFGLGSTTASEMLTLLEMLHERKLVSPEASDAMLEHLRQCQDKRLSRLLPPGTKVAHKTGSVSAVRTDAGFIDAPSGRIAICVLTRNNKDQRWTDENAAEVLTSRIARAVYDYFEADAPETVAGESKSPTELRRGATGELVQSLQRTLNARLRPSPELSVDGDFGPATEAAVIAFQRSKNLEPDGIVNPQTLAALGPLLFSDRPIPDPDAINGEELSREPPEPLDAPPLTTCKAWAIADAKTGEVKWNKQAADKLDIASTTKIMTAYIVLRLAEKDPAVLDEIATFSETADKTTGSTAGIRAGEQLSVRELLYGLLLPSGNDASVALAEHFGPRLAKRDAEGGSQVLANGNSPVEYFINEMNRQAKELGMNETQYANPHGLTATDHKSSARDLVKLAHAALKMPAFREYVSTRQRGAKVTGPGGYERNVLWRNTNQLLRIEGYQGIKTGTTNAAGACLVSLGERGGREFIVVVLGSTNSDARYVDSRNLFRWAWQQIP